MKPHWFLTGVVLVLAACAAGTAAPPATAPDPGGAPAVGTPAAPTAPSPIRLRPATLRYAVHRRLTIEQELAGTPPTHMSYRVFLTAAVTEPADSAGYPVTHTVDSIVPDSGSFLPPTVNFAAARGLRFSGRLAPTGQVRDIVPSDSVAAQTFAQFLGNLRDFYPRLPAGGLLPDAVWTDTVTTTERNAGAEVVVHAVHQSTAAGWDQRNGTPCLRIEVRGTFTMQGSGEQSGQPFELAGSGTRVATEFVSAEGRYLGGEARDSMSLSVSLPAQGINVPIRQLVHSTVVVVP